MKEEISVRQWQERFRAGAFDSPDLDAQCRAGWYDWFCQDRALAGRLKKIARVVMGITSPFILDNYYVWFKNNLLVSGPLYDDVRFEPLSGERDGKYFLVTLDYPPVKEKWALTTERYGFGTPEFACANVRDMVRYVDKLGAELEQGIQPVFIAEKFAVEVYAHICGEPLGLQVYWEGEHRYSYTSFQDKQRRVVMTSARAEDVPPGLDSEKIRGIHVWRADSAEKEQRFPQRKANKSTKRREPER